MWRVVDRGGVCVEISARRHVRRQFLASSERLVNGVDVDKKSTKLNYVCLERAGQGVCAATRVDTWPRSAVQQQQQATGGQGGACECCE